MQATELSGPIRQAIHSLDLLNDCAACRLFHTLTMPSPWTHTREARKYAHCTVFFYGARLKFGLKCME